MLRADKPPFPARLASLDIRRLPSTAALALIEAGQLLINGGVLRFHFPGLVEHGFGLIKVAGHAAAFVSGYPVAREFGLDAPYARWIPVVTREASRIVVNVDRDGVDERQRASALQLGAELADTERAQIDNAVAVVRAHRSVHLGMPGIHPRQHRCCPHHGPGPTHEQARPAATGPTP